MYGWSKERFYHVIKPLLQEGILWVDIYNGMYIYVLSI